MLTYIKTLLVIYSVFVSFHVSAHSGGKDENGGHFDKNTGKYHCHDKGCIDPSISETEDSFVFPDGVPAPSLRISGSWGDTKKVARDVIYKGQATTFYCGCSYTPKGKSGGQINQSSCDYDGNGAVHKSRASRLEWEHVVPASLMPARQMACWNEGLPQCKEGGRECCEKHDLNAKAQIFDLHNLVPSVGQTNALRSNKRYGLIEGEELELGSCDFEWTKTLTEPPEAKRGEVARVWLYFVSQHGLVLAPGELEMYLRWSKKDPPEDWEVLRNERIKEYQGNSNPFIDMFKVN